LKTDDLYHHETQGRSRGAPDTFKTGFVSRIVVTNQDFCGLRSQCNGYMLLFYPTPRKFLLPEASVISPALMALI